MNKIKWAWHHRRKMSLHHLDIFVSGVVNNGYLPALDYIQKQQLAVVLPGNDTYLFDDDNELQKLYNSILKQIREKKLFANDLYTRNNELFGSLLLHSGDMRISNLSLYTSEKLADLYDEFMELMTKAPIIRIQLTGIDACWSKNSPLHKELKKQAKDETQYKEWVQIISHFEGESVAKTEQMDFLLLVNRFYKNNEVRKLLTEKKFKIVVDLLSKKYKILNQFLAKHMEKYEWVSSEYTGSGWNVVRWLQEVAKFIDIDPTTKIGEIQADDKKKTVAKKKLIKHLRLTKESLKVTEALNCFSVLRDWSKGFFVRALLDHRYLMTEMSKRLSINLNDLLCFSVKEVGRLFRNGYVDSREIELRSQNGSVLSMTDRKKKIYSDLKNINRIKNMPVVSDIFDNKDDIKEFRGRTAFPGLVRGRVRVVLKSQDIQKVEKGDILVTYMTTMEFIPVFKKIAALITDEGSISSHAAIISREFKIPCIVGSKVATRTLKNGDLVEIDANQGIVRVLD